MGNLLVTLLASGFWLLASGFWLLASGFWLLASGFWLLLEHVLQRELHHPDHFQPDATRRSVALANDGVSATVVRLKIWRRSPVQFPRSYLRSAGLV